MRDINAIRTIERRLGVSAVRDADKVSRERGAYLILLALDRPVGLAIRAFRGIAVPSGQYIYAGSACGPGGLRARIARHLRRDKSRHWHIDNLTTAASDIAAIAVPAGDECALVEILLESGEHRQPIAGFGSSDCHTCISHLLAFSKGDPDADHREIPVYRQHGRRSG